MPRCGVRVAPLGDVIGLTSAGAVLGFLGTMSTPCSARLLNVDVGPLGWVRLIANGVGSRPVATIVTAEDQ